MLHAARTCVHQRGPRAPTRATPSQSCASSLVVSPKALRVPAGDPAFWKRCSACEQTWQLGTRPCQRCTLGRKIIDRLSDRTGIISDGLAPLHQALTAVERPATVRAWLDLPPVRTLLAGLSRDHRP
jgi:hypothetical protein